MTPQTIDVTGLSPAAVEAVGRMVALLRAGAAPAAGEKTAEEWVAGWNAWCDSHPTRDIEFDDSRESIYGGQAGAGPSPAARSGPPPGETAEEWVARFDAMIKRHAVHGVVADDGRDGIYDRETE